MNLHFPSFVLISTIGIILNPVQPRSQFSYINWLSAIVCFALS